jgi:uncharacterized protein YndB with AHSA1/START domain
MSTQYVYVTYIRTTPEKLWAALTDADTMRKYWFNMHIDTDWKTGSPWKMANAEGKVFDMGEILEVERNKRVVMRWRNEWKPELKAEGFTVCTYDLEPADGAVKLTVTHTSEVDNSQLIVAVSGGWPKILSNLKSLLETGEIALASH